MSLLDTINTDLKQALLSGDKLKSETLKGIKSALQYLQTSANAKETLTDEDILSVLKKESKKRQEASEAYDKAGDQQRSDKEKQEKTIIDAYLPEQMSSTQLEELIEEVISDNNIELSPKSMGELIKLVREKAGSRADGSAIAKAVKEKIAG